MAPMIQGVDYAWGRPDPAAIKRAGYLFALRYLATGGPSVSGKVIGLAERQALHAAGLGVGLVWETYPNRPLEGVAAGNADGLAARAQAKALGFSDGFPIFGAVDFNPPSSQYPAGQITLAGAQVDVNDAYETCCIWFPAQSQPQVHIQSVPAPVAPPVHYQEDNVTKLSANVPTLDDQGNGNITIPGVAGRVVSVAMNGNDPNHEGYDGQKPSFSWSDRGSDVLLVIQGGKPHAGFNVNVWAVG